MEIDVNVQNNVIICILDDQNFFLCSIILKIFNLMYCSRHTEC